MAMNNKMRKEVPSAKAVILKDRIGFIGVDLSASLQWRRTAAGIFKDS
jgi:hypothetical protein